MILKRGRDGIDGAVHTATTRCQPNARIGKALFCGAEERGQAAGGGSLPGPKEEVDTGRMILAGEQLTMFAQRVALEGQAHALRAPGFDNLGFALFGPAQRDQRPTKRDAAFTGHRFTGLEPLGDERRAHA